MVLFIKLKGQIENPGIVNVITYIHVNLLNGQNVLALLVLTNLYRLIFSGFVCIINTDEYTQECA